jgi:hypothetical protein
MHGNVFSAPFEQYNGIDYGLLENFDFVNPKTDFLF